MKLKHLKKYGFLYLAIIGIILLMPIGYLLNGTLISFNGWRWQK